MPRSHCSFATGQGSQGRNAPIPSFLPPTGRAFRSFPAMSASPIVACRQPTMNGSRRPQRASFTPRPRCVSTTRSTRRAASTSKGRGTSSILRWARLSCDASPMSGTAYVAGERSDLVREDELVVGQGYRNTYEQTKAEAETLVRSRLGSLPGVILRPSIIVGDSRTGVTSSFKMMYWPLKIYARRLWRTVPGYPDAVLDIVPVDFVADSVARLLFDEAALG